MDDSAPLLETPEAKAPPGGEAQWYAGAGGAKLRAALFRPTGQARGSVILSGGRSEPIEKYYEVIADFLDRGFVVLAHDWRGQGLSVREMPDRLKGHARGGYRNFLDDYSRLLTAYQSQLPKPWIAVGHSMGGCLALLALVSGERRIASAVLSAPMLGLKLGRMPVSTAAFAARTNLFLGRAGQYLPKQPRRAFEDAFDNNILTHDPVRFARTAALIEAHPDLALGAPTWGWLDFALKAMAYLANPDRLRGVTAPVIIVSAGDDKLVDNAAMAAAARHLPQGKLIAIPGANHEILMETDEMRNIFLRAFDALIGRTAPKPAEPPKAAPATPPTPVVATTTAVPATTAPKPAAPVTTAAKPAAAPAAKKPAARKPAAKKPAAAKPVAAKVPAKAAAPKAAVKKPAAKPVAAKKAPAAAKPAAKPAVAKKPATAAKKPAAKAAPKPKPAVAKTPAVKKPAAKPAAAKKPATVAKKPAAKKPAPKK
jgi:lysophospholipase